MIMRGHCFVIMPFNSQFNGYYKKIFSPPIRQQNLTPVRVDEIYTPTQISADIFKLIQGAQIVLADVTGKNPNVNYELGIAHALGKKAVIVTQSEDDIPFDYRHIRYIVYNTKSPGWESSLKKSVRNAIAAALRENKETKVLQGIELRSILMFIRNMQRDFSYEMTKDSVFESDECGSCKIHQVWDVLANSDISHLMHEICIDKAGAIGLVEAIDKTNGESLSTVIIQANDKSLAYALLLSRLLRRGERILVELNAHAENYISDLFDRGRVTIFHRSSPRSGVQFTKKTEKYILPLNDFTRNVRVEFNNTTQFQEASVCTVDKKVILSVVVGWNEPHDGMCSYEIIA